MCGRYALGIRASFIRYQLQQQGVQVDDAPEDDQVRETYNFPPGSFGIVYRADVPDTGIRDEEQQDVEASSHDAAAAESERAGTNTEIAPAVPSSPMTPKQYKYQLKAMKWGLIPFWTKRSPDYASMLRTINCRDDSLSENRGMWNTMKQRKRCLVVCQGFYEWLKKGPSGKERIPYFVKRKDGQLMCFAGLWDCVKYEGADEKLYTYTIITTDPNKQLSFLHDRMPVILDPTSEAAKIWLDPERNKWSKELQSILKPYEGELECYPVNRDVGKVGNNSPDFIVPIDSKQNKKNIANFFGNAKSQKADAARGEVGKLEAEPAVVETAIRDDVDNPETNAPLPVSSQEAKGPLKRSHSPDDTPGKFRTIEKSPIKSPIQSPGRSDVKKTRSATSNAKVARAAPQKAKDGTQRITNFFVK